MNTVPHIDLDLSSLEKAVGQLSSGLARAELDRSDEIVRDGTIQRFECAYELSHKLLRRHLALTEPSPDYLDTVTYFAVIPGFLADASYLLQQLKLRVVGQ